MTAARQLPVFDTMRSAWQQVSGTKAVFWSFLWLFIGLVFMLGFCAGLFRGTALAIVMQVVSKLALLLVSWMATYVGIQWVRYKSINVGMIWNVLSFPTIARMICFYLLLVAISIPCVGIIVFIGLSLSMPVVAGVLAGIVYVYVMFRLYFVRGIILGTQLSFWEGVKLSWKVSNGNVLRLIGFTACNILIIIASLIPFFLGAIWTLPYLYISYAEACNRMVFAQDEI